MTKRFFQIIFVLVFLELMLRLLGINKTFMEKYKGEYDYFFGQSRNSWYHTWPSNHDLEFGQEEFTYLNHYNDLGHRERDFSDFLSDTSETKIICLGDSFTEGDGAPYDSSWVRTFEKFYLQKDSSLAVYNAGVCGSDALFNHVIFRDKLIDAHPDIVIECLNNSDITDIYYRGGMDRFRDDGTFVSSNPKKWEVAYKYSYLFRALVTTFTFYDQNLVNTRTLKADEQEAMQIIADQVNETHQLCENIGAKYILVIMPIPGDIEYPDEIPFQDIKAMVSPEVALIDLYPSMFKTFDALNLEDYSWEMNGHYNSKGYDIVGKQIFLAVQDSMNIN